MKPNPMLGQGTSQDVPARRDVAELRLPPGEGMRVHGAHSI